MYIKRATIDARPTGATHHKTPDGRIIVKHNDQFYGFRPDHDSGTAKVLDGLIDEPGNLDDIPLPVFRHIREMGFKIEVDTIQSDVIDAEHSVPEAYELWC